MNLAGQLCSSRLLQLISSHSILPGTFSGTLGKSPLPQAPRTNSWKEQRGMPTLRTQSQHCGHRERSSSSRPTPRLDGSARRSSRPWLPAGDPRSPRQLAVPPWQHPEGNRGKRALREPPVFPEGVRVISSPTFGGHGAAHPVLPSPPLPSPTLPGVLQQKLFLLSSSQLWGL